MIKHISQRTGNFLHSGQIFSSLQSKNYRRYFIGQGISLIGSWMQSIAMSWLVYRLTGSKFLLGFIGFTSQIPSFFLSPFAGVLTDRFSRKNIMLSAQILFMVHAILFSILSLTELIEIWQIIVLSILFGLISAFDVPARQSLVIDLIDNPRNLGNAIALNSALFNGARLIGPAIAGIVIALVGEGICFAINALSYVAIILSLLKISSKPKDKIPNSQSIKEQFIEGLKYTFGFKPIRTLIILLAVISLTGLPFVTLMPAYVGEILKGESNTYGFLMSTTGAGALLGAIYLASKKTVVGLEKLIIFTSALFGVSILGFSLSEYLVFSMILGFFAGFSMIATIASINTLIQTLADENKRGRVMSFYAMALMGTVPIGSLISGIIADIIGLRLEFLFSAVILILVSVWFAYSWPKFKELVNLVFKSKDIL